MRMNIRILNLMDAFHLASIVSKYVDIATLSEDAVDFIQGIVEKISPQEFITCVSIMTDKTEEDVKKEVSLEILTAFIEGLKMNQIISLISFYKNFGF